MLDTLLMAWAPVTTNTSAPSAKCPAQLDRQYDLGATRGLTQNPTSSYLSNARILDVGFWSPGVSVPADTMELLGVRAPEQLTGSSRTALSECFRE